MIMSSVEYRTLILWSFDYTIVCIARVLELRHVMLPSEQYEEIRMRS